MKTKNKTNITKKTINAFYKTELVGITLNKCREALTRNDSYEFEQNLLNAVIQSEQNTLSLRRFFIENVDNNVLKNDLKDRLYTALDINIFFENNIVSIKMPPLIHRTKQNENDKISYSDCINLPLAIALSDFKNKNHLAKFNEEVVVYIQNVVSNNAPRSTVPDTDNYEYKDLLNTVTSVFLPDDSFEYVSLYHCSKRSFKPSHTIVKIISKRCFANFITQESSPFSIHNDNKKIAIINDKKTANLIA